MEIQAVFHMNLDTQLNNFEIKCRESYKRNPNLHQDHPQSSDKINRLLMEIEASGIKDFSKTFFDKALEENRFIHKDLDVAVVRHQRYLPVAWHEHDFFEVVCVLNGNCTNYISTEEIKMTEGDICIIAPGVTHAISVFSDESIVLNLLLRKSSFEHSFIPVLSENDILSEFFLKSLYGFSSRSYLYFQMDKDEELFNYIAYAYHEYVRQRSYKERMINSILTAFFITLLRNHVSDVVFRDSSCERKNENVIYILKYLQEHFTDVTISELASFFNYSERQIQRIIKNSTGKSFNKNIQSLKMKKAARLLEETDMNIAEISDVLNYSDQAIFRRNFKEYYGITPSSFRAKDAGTGS